MVKSKLYEYSVPAGSPELAPPTFVNQMAAGELRIIEYKPVQVFRLHVH